MQISNCRVGRDGGHDDHGLDESYHEQYAQFAQVHFHGDDRDHVRDDHVRDYARDYARDDRARDDHARGDHARDDHARDDHARDDRDHVHDGVHDDVHDYYERLQLLLPQQRLRRPRFQHL